jgi:hypothetical protein
MSAASPAFDSRANVQRTKSVGFRVRPQEHDELLNAAEEAGMPIGEWIRDVALRSARGNGRNDDESSAKLLRLGLEEIVGLRALLVTLFGNTHPDLTKNQVDQILQHVDSIKNERADALIQRQR